MIKSDKGITLVILVVTILLLLILTVVGLNLSFTGITETIDSREVTQLGIVRQAVMEQYNKAIALNQIKVATSKPKVSFWVGERITDFSMIDLPDETILTKTEDSNEFYAKQETYQCDFQEEYYYRLRPEDLNQIGISDAKDTYIVNYSTCEVYNETKKINSNGELLYLPSTKTKEQVTDEGDKESFNDWKLNG